LTIDIRAAALDDVLQLHSLIQDHAAFERSAAPLTAPDLATIINLDRPPVRLLVAGNMGVIVGYAAVTFEWSLWRARTYGHLDCLFVAERTRGGGVGSKLLEAAIRLVSTEGADRLEWQTPAWNGNAIYFYLRHGAESADKKRFVLPIGHAY
jgi:GNAT superfamily N-acetyltransferase